MSNISRRSFLQRGAAAAAAFSIVPGSILGKSHGYVAPTDKLNIAAVGIGGMGHANINSMQKALLKNIRMQKNIGIIVRCMTKWVNPSMLSSSQLPIILMP